MNTHAFRSLAVRGVMAPAAADLTGIEHEGENAWTPMNYCKKDKNS